VLQPERLLELDQVEDRWTGGLGRMILSDAPFDCAASRPSSNARMPVESR
jgi:hypothetical protein